MPFRPSRRLPRRLTTLSWLWLLAAVLVLKSAVPMLASMAAERQGVSFAEVCSVYGVRLVAVPLADAPGAAADTGHEAPATAHAAGEHCALGVLLAAPAPHAVQTALAPAPAAQPAAWAPRRAPSAPDASQRWLIARLHAPPFVS